MSKPDTWMPFYIADYLRDTMHLTRDQHGGYMLLLMACWDRGGRLPNDQGQLAGIAKASAVEWRRIGPILMEFFTVEGNYIVQRRVLAEYDKANRLSETRREAGRQGGRPRKQTETNEESKEETKPKANEKAKPKQTETPAYVARPSQSQKSPVSNETDGEPSSSGDLLTNLRALPIAKSCWRLALHLLTERGGLAEGKARSFVGRLKAAGLTDDELWAISEDAWNAGTLDPVPYLTKAAERLAQNRVAQGGITDPPERQQRAWAQDWLEVPFQWKVHERGPRPGEPGCRISPVILAEYGILGEDAA